MHSISGLYLCRQAHQRSAETVHLHFRAGESLMILGDLITAQADRFRADTVCVLDVIVFHL